MLYPPSSVGLGTSLPPPRGGLPGTPGRPCGAACPWWYWPTPPGSLLAIERGSVSPTLRSPARESWQLQSRQRGSSRQARGGRSRVPPELAHPPTHRFAEPVEIVSLVGNLDVLFDVKRHVGNAVPREVLHGSGEDAVAFGVVYG